WMDVPDTSPNFNAARKKHTPDTGNWLLDGSAFKRWKENPDLLLWLHGGPGCGKTVLWCAVIDFCDSKASTGYAYFFFDARSAEAALLAHEKLVRSIIMQLAHQCDGIPVALTDMYARCQHGSRQPPIDVLEATLLRIITSFDSVFIVIDSLDECSEREEIVQWIHSIVSSASGKLHMAVSSRPEPEIMQGLRLLSQLTEVSISGHRIESDIRSYLNTWLSQHDAAKWTNTQKEMIGAALMDGADGMFRWVALQADHLIKSASPRELAKRLKSLPRDLNESYSRTLAESLDPGNLKRFLQWLAYSRRAMTINEIAEVAVIDFGDNDSGLPVYEADRRFADPDHVFSLCYGLITEVEGTIAHSCIIPEVIKLAHFSVKEYLISEHIFSGAAANFHTDEQLSHSVIAQTSLAYLFHFDKSTSLSEDTLPSFPLAQYAAEYWITHFHSAGFDYGNDGALQQLSVQLFDPSSSYVMRNWLCLYDPEWPQRGVEFFNLKLNKFITPISPVHYACRIGVTAAVANLIKNGADFSHNRGRGRSGLTAACNGGHLEIVQLLLTHGVDIDAGGYSGTALQEAASEGHLEIVQLLLAHGADVEVRGGNSSSTALQDAASKGHLAIVELLLAHGANIGAGSGINRTALQRAAYEGHLEVTQLLLSHGADANEPEGSSLGHALYVASSEGHLEIVELLLVHGAHVNAVGGLLEAPALLLASERGHLGVVQLLLAHGAHVNAKSSISQTALSQASAWGRVAIAELLREHGAVEVEQPNFVGFCSACSISET
ncbi:ankyrin, partial [Athelia psychrophila]